jgi:rare lipoprotein A
VSRNAHSTALALALAVFLTSCAHKKKAVNAPPPAPVATGAPAGAPPALPGSAAPPAPTPAPPTLGATETGIASWYGHPYHGRPAADGEIYDMETMVAAHRTLPFHTIVRVYDLDNGKTVDVTIIDRGPFVDGRIIDLSHAAAVAIGMVGPGTANVRVEILQAPQPLASGLFAVQVGAFRDRANAERTQREMQMYGETRVVLEKGFWRVLVGRETTEDGAKALAARIRKNSPEKNTAFVVRIDSEAT